VLTMHKRKASPVPHDLLLEREKRSEEKTKGFFFFKASNEHSSFKCFQQEIFNLFLLV